MIIHDNEMKYAESQAPTISEMKAFNAASDPRLMRDKRMVITRETITALSGTFLPGLTCIRKMLAEES